MFHQSYYWHVLSSRGIVKIATLKKNQTRLVLFIHDVYVYLDCWPHLAYHGNFVDVKSQPTCLADASNNSVGFGSVLAYCSNCIIQYLLAIVLQKRTFYFSLQPQPISSIRSRRGKDNEFGKSRVLNFTRRLV